MQFELFPELWFGPLIATFVWSLLIGATAWVLVYHTPLFNRFLTVQFDSVFCTMLNLIFVFFMAFMGSEFHANYKSATDTLATEKAIINQLLQTEMPTEALKEQKTLAIRTYLNNVVALEWRQNFNRQESAGAEQALASLTAIAYDTRKMCTDVDSAACMDRLFITRYLNSVDDLREVRDYRLAIGSLERQTLRYLLCMFLALNATLSVLALYRTDRQAALVPLVMYCASLWIAFMIVVLHAEPYVGVRGVDPAPLEQLLFKLRT